MKTITIKNISKSYPNKNLFEGVSFSVTKGDRIAIIGSNGTGKSTLLKIISGLETLSSGKIIQENAVCEYVSQEFNDKINLSILKYLETTHASSSVFSIIKKFEVISDKQVKEGYLHELSGGQKRILEIAGALSRSPMFLCLDEPENHLDIKARMILSGLLQDYWGAILFVSHDRYLINDISTKIFSLQNNSGILTVGKTYEQFLLEEKLKTNNTLAHFKAESKSLNKLEDTVRMLKKRTRYNDSQAKTYQMKKRQLAERQKALGKMPETEPRIPSIQTGSVKQKEGKLILQTHMVTLAYTSSSIILKDINVELRFGEKIVLLGRNGTGKSTFLKLATQELIPTEGSVKIGNDIAIEHINQSNSLDLTLSPLEHFTEIGFTEENALSILAQFLFTQSESKTSLEILSGGQQQRFKFLLLFKASPEFIILDEPTNNLDPTTWELLLQLVNDYTGSLLLVSHDRSFVEQIEKKRIWVLKNRTIAESWSDLDEILKEL